MQRHRRSYGKRSCWSLRDHGRLSADGRAEAVLSVNTRAHGGPGEAPGPRGGAGPTPGRAEVEVSK